MAMYNSETPSLDARLQGIGVFSATANIVSDHYFEIDGQYMFNGIELYAWDSNIGDNISLSSEYNIGSIETPVWKRYKKYGKSWNVFPNSPERIVLFPADLTVGVRLKFSYDNKHATSAVNFCVNLFTYIDQIEINTSIAEEGEDW